MLERVRGTKRSRRKLLFYVGKTSIDNLFNTPFIFIFYEGMWSIQNMDFPVYDSYKAI